VHGRRRPRSIFWRIALTNSAVLVIACIVVGLVFSRRSGLERFALDEAAVVFVAVLALAAVNFLVLRHAFAPLGRLIEFARRVDLANPAPAEKLSDDGATTEVANLTRAINQMLARLTDERRSNARRVIVAQESERRRIAQELHDEVGQTLTAVLLELEHAAERAPEDLREKLTDTREHARESLEDVRRIAVELRPEALDELGLASALVAMCDRLDGQSDGPRIERSIERDLPDLTDEQELVVYRVAQEALTNVVRHSGSPTAHVSLRRHDSTVSLQVSDQGRGFGGASGGTGLAGIRERAGLLGAALSIGQGAEGGVTVRLDVFTEGSEAARA